MAAPVLTNIQTSFSTSTDVPKKIVPIQTMTMNKLDIGRSPASIQSGVDDSKHQLIFTSNNPAQPGQSDKIIVNFGPGTTGVTNRNAAYAAVLAAGSSV